MLQMDADVMFSRCEDDDVISEMKSAVGADQVFGVGFNILNKWSRGSRIQWFFCSRS